MKNTLTEVKVEEDFIVHRAHKSSLYNRETRSERKFLMDIDCELVEFINIREGIWYEHPTWHVDAITKEGHNIDCKFMQKYWNLSKKRVSNILQQYGIINYYHLYRWEKRPNRPLEVGDNVSFRCMGILPYETVMQNMRPSRKDPGGMYITIERLIP